MTLRELCKQLLEANNILDLENLAEHTDALAAWAEEAAAEFRGVKSDCQCFEWCPKCEGATALLSRFDSEIGGGR